MTNAKRWIVTIVLVSLLSLTIAPSQVNFGGVNSPPAFGFVIIPDNNINLPTVTRSIWVGTGGNLEIIYAGNDADLVLRNVPTGSRVEGRFSRVRAASTTAQNLRGEY